MFAHNYVTKVFKMFKYHISPQRTSKIVLKVESTKQAVQSPGGVS